MRICVFSSVKCLQQAFVISQDLGSNFGPVDCLPDDWLMFLEVLVNACSVSIFIFSFGG